MSGTALLLVDLGQENEYKKSINYFFVSKMFSKYFFPNVEVTRRIEIMKRKQMFFSSD